MRTTIGILKKGEEERSGTDLYLRHSELWSRTLFFPLRHSNFPSCVRFHRADRVLANVCTCMYNTLHVPLFIGVCHWLVEWEERTRWAVSRSRSSLLGYSIPVCICVCICICVCVSVSLCVCVSVSLCCCASGPCHHCLSLCLYDFLPWGSGLEASGRSSMKRLQTITTIIIIIMNGPGGDNN